MQAIITKYLPPTASHGARIKAMADGGMVTIPYPYEAKDEQARHMTAAVALCFKLNWTYHSHMVGGSLPSLNKWDYAFVLIPRSEIKFDKSADEG